jgi:hypothetical protein
MRALRQRAEFADLNHHRMEEFDNLNGACFYEGITFHLSEEE